MAHTLAEAAKTVRNIKEIDVKRLSAKVEKNQITEYRAVDRITFRVEREILHPQGSASLLLQDTEKKIG